METLCFNFKNLSEEEIKEIKRLEKKSRVWKPDIGETYYSITNGKVEEFVYDGEEASYSDWKIGNCYKTEEDATFDMERQLFIIKVQRYIKEKYDKSKNHSYYYLKYGYWAYNKIEIVQDDFFRYGESLCFPTEEIAEEVIKLFRDDLIKYYFLKSED